MINRIKIVIIVTLFSILLGACSKNVFKSDLNFTVAFYNVENLFDTINEPGKNDGEFTPGGSKKWTDERYLKKVEDIAKVLSSINSNELPEIIGLCEVENRKVVKDLVENDLLVQGNYHIVHYESPDRRGIDNAFIYRPDEFEVISSQPILVTFEGQPNFHTRDILYVKGKTNNDEEMHFFVNHWPSRIGGTDETESSRLQVAYKLKNKIDSIQSQNNLAKIIVMGDMNDEPSNLSLTYVLGAAKPENSNSELVNLMYPVYEQNLGSYVYQGDWNMLDNIVISSNLLDDEGMKCVEKQGYVFHQEWMEYINSDGQISPNKTYGGANYYGGVSDHFPVYFILKR